MSFLSKILEITRTSVERRKGKERLAQLRAQAMDAPPTRGFSRALSTGAGFSPRLIAEIKRASPSAGRIRDSFDPVAIAHLYEKHGASALSVLTEPNFFEGHLAYLHAIHNQVHLPLLQKDFIVDALQIYEARVFGADACLLIAAALSPAQLVDYFHLACELTLDTVIEVHTEKELESVLDWAPLIGINNRDLATLQTDVKVTLRLLSCIPNRLRHGHLWVSESGIHSAVQIQWLREAGVDAVLIGEALMSSARIDQAISTLMAPIT